MTRETVQWMLDADPALRWQVERDLVGAPEAQWRATRARVGVEGMGKRLLDEQDPDGQWAGGTFFPADFDFDGPEAQPGTGQPWTATTPTLNLLRDWGTDAALLGDTAEKLALTRWEYDDLPYWGGEVDCCINAETLANGAWLGADVAGIADWFLEHQLAEGGWNCEWVEGSVRASVDSTLNALKGMLYYEKTVGGSELTAARHAGEEYLLERRLLYRLTDGDPIEPRIAELGYPFRWRYSALNALNHFREASLFDRTAPDPRLAEAVGTVRAARQPDGTWLQEVRHPGRVWFDVDVPVGEPSPWVTFFATRVLDWWDNR